LLEVNEEPWNSSKTNQNVEAGRFGKNRDNPRIVEFVTKSTLLFFQLELKKIHKAG